jgi:hypothetical protein
LQEGKTLTRTQKDTCKRAGGHLREGKTTLTRGQKDTYEGRSRARTGGQEYTYERVGGHLREESDEELEGEP